MRQITPFCTCLHPWLLLVRPNNGFRFFVLKVAFSVLFYLRFLPEIEFYFQVDFGLLVWRAPMTLGVGLLYVIYS